MPEVQLPQYELSEAAYIDDVLYGPGRKVTYEGAPGHHMEPVNEAAKVMKKKHDKGGYIDPIEAMTKVN